MRQLARFAAWRLGLVRIDPWAMSVETECLIRHAAGKRRLAEIGVWEGGTTRRLRTVMDPGGVLFAIDPFPVGRLGVSYQQAIAKGEVARVKNGRVVWIRETGAAAATDPRVAAEPFDFVFIDGDHTDEGIRQDWREWSPLASSIVALHDAVGIEQGSARFFEQHIVHDPRFEVVETAGCLAVLRRMP